MGPTMSHRLTKRELERLSVAVDRWMDGGPPLNADAVSRLLAHAVLCDALLDRIRLDIGQAVPDEIAAHDDQ